jgi:hypothetical protein
MMISEFFERYHGHFVDVRMVDEEEFIKTVFQQSKTIDHGQITRPFILADIVPDGDENEYVRKYAENPDSFQKIPLSESQVAEVKVGNKINF